MKHYDDITPALQGILRSWSTGDTLCWIGFRVEREKLEGIRSKWIENYGTNLSAEKRRWRREKGLPTAWGCSMPVLGYPDQVECVLLASRDALSAKDGPFSKEKWKTCPPEASDFVMVREPRERRDYAWTWRIKNRQLGLLDHHLVMLVKAGDAGAVAKTSYQWVRFYPLFGGIRRQIRRMYRGSSKLWMASKKSNWPGPDPEHLPAMIGFKKELQPRPLGAVKHA